SPRPATHIATVRLRTTKTKGSGNRSACLTMVFKLMESAAKKWRLLNGSPLLIADFHEDLRCHTVISGLRDFCSCSRSGVTGRRFLAVLLAVLLASPR